MATQNRYLSEVFYLQECIPLGCILPPSAAISGLVGVVCMGYVGAYATHYGQTDACENITFPHLRLRAVMVHLSST